MTDNKYYQKIRVLSLD